MKKVFLLTLLVLFGTFEVKAAFKKNEKRILSEQVLKDKVKGAWAGQTLGCSYGGPTEFKFLGTIIQDYIPIPWDKHTVKNWYDTFPAFKPYRLRKGGCAIVTSFLYDSQFGCYRFNALILSSILIGIFLFLQRNRFPIDS